MDAERGFHVRHISIRQVMLSIAAVGMILAIVRWLDLVGVAYVAVVLGVYTFGRLISSEKRWTITLVAGCACTYSLAAIKGMPLRDDPIYFVVSAPVRTAAMLDPEYAGIVYARGTRDVSPAAAVVFWLAIAVPLAVSLTIDAVQRGRK